MEKILMIEDKAQTRDIFLYCLSFEGYCAVGTENGSSRIGLARTHLPDLVVCDIMMPDLDSYAVLSALRQEPLTASISLIFLTAKMTMTDLRYGIGLETDNYLTKPWTIERFLAAIATRLQRQDVLRQWYADRSPTSSPAMPSHSVKPCTCRGKPVRWKNLGYESAV